MNIAYPGPDRQERERHGIGHLARILPAAEASGLITSWWWIRKGPWRIRYLLNEETGGRDPVHPLLTASVTWTGDIYEPEVHAFGGPASMDAAHALFHRDSRHLLSYLHNKPADRREHSLVLCTALMRAAGLDWIEQGDVWAKVAEQRDGLQPSAPTSQAWASFTSDVRLLLLGTACPGTIADDWLTAFAEAGRSLRALRETGELTRGLRTVIALHVIFHLNRIGIPATAQATLALAAKDTIFGSTSA
ncbi:thiopeptide-type bacteriocin biosynthesis protein [Actinoallomurus acaciae]|uniref:Thiopeptide-type bacteriocin biosynthesis protein n=1 Tax=Actinoallomurus acaciae TaxID=502577 RepID=A0ABV5Y7M3_9ACTN